MTEASLLKDNRQMLIAGLVVVLILVLLSGGIYLYQSKGKVAGAIEDKETVEVVEKISKLMELPEGEKPTMATVSDPAQLLGQPFFTRAKVGDKVLIYLQAKKAIIFRPSTNKIINVGPVNVNQPAPTEIPQQQPRERPTLTPRPTPTKITTPTLPAGGEPTVEPSPTASP